MITRCFDGIRQADGDVKARRRRQDARLDACSLVSSARGTAYVEYFLLAAVMAALTVLLLWNQRSAICEHYEATMFRPSMSSLAGPVSPPSAPVAGYCESLM